MDVISIKNLKYIGYFITIIAFYYIIRSILKLDIDYLGLVKNKYAIQFVIIFSILFSLLVYLNSYIWKTILEYINVDKIPYVNIMGIYIKSNMGKYLPGNVMQYVGRNIISKQLGWSHTKITFSSIMEIILFIITATILSLVFAFEYAISYFRLTINNIVSKPLYIALSLICITLAIFAIKIYLLKDKSLVQILQRYCKKNLLFFTIKIFIMQSIVFIFMGLILFMTLFFISNISIQLKDTYIVMSTFIVAWLTGFILPGVPGGLGVRESILLFTLSPMYGEDKVILAILVHRLISIFGDIIAFLSCILFSKKKKPIKSL